MDAISLKIEGNLLAEIDKTLSKHRYSTRTEFIRDAIREKLSELEKDELLRATAKFRGYSKRKTTDEQMHEARDKAFALLEKKLGVR